MKLTKRAIIIITSGLLLTGGVAVAKQGPFCGTAEERGERMVEKVSKKLDLNDSQKDKLNIVKNELINVRKTIRNHRDQRQSEIFSMLDQPTLDREKIRSIITQKTAEINTRSPAIINAFGDFYDSLDNSQRAKMKEIIENRMAHRDRWFQG